MAIGAGRWRILRQLLVEAIVISTFGVRAHVASPGWPLLAWLAGIRHQIPYKVPSAAAAVVDPVAFLISVLAGVVFGLMPLRQIFKTDPK